ncbi:MAG: 7-cyano-7-deazaguanine synthase, partial [Deltaproteobacteria bacterium]|nr:7-cyano-7-deazaguanine synthase [Deltaproteobacteria bacterium]
IAASFAESLRAEVIVVGFNAEEAMTFPDNSSDFVKEMNASLSTSTLNHVQVICYTQSLNKKQIVSLGKELRAPFELMWSCYEGGERMCRQCESCKRFYRAMGN